MKMNLGMSSEKVLPQKTLSNPVASESDPIGDALRAGCVAYYPFESDGMDVSGNDNNLTPINNPGFVAGKVGNATDLTYMDGENHTIDSNSDLVMGDIDFGFSLWMRLN